MLEGRLLFQPKGMSGDVDTKEGLLESLVIVNAVTCQRLDVQFSWMYNINALSGGRNHWYSALSNLPTRLLFFFQMNLPRTSRFIGT